MLIFREEYVSYAGNSIDRNTSFFVWVGLIDKLLGVKKIVSKFKEKEDAINGITRNLNLMYSSC